MRLQLVAAMSMLLVVGCRLLHDPDRLAGRSPLQPARSSSDSVTMEIIWVRFPLADQQLNEEVWQEIDETQIEPATKRALADNGFRAGVIGGAPPAAIARALRMGEAESADAPKPGSPQPLDLLVEPTVRGRIQQLRRNQRTEIQASEVCPSMPLLVSDQGELRGRTYHDVQAIYALKVDPQPDRMVVLELTPELHYGPAQIRWTSGEEGVLRTAPLRDREVFERLRMTVKLAPGEMLVLLSLPDAASRLGHYFHTVEAAEGRQQKLILVRPSQLPPSDTFATAAEF
ncbi:MAG: hypothetical protein L0Z07_04230 [Planctomycetes bacterium]|nr:hypothetical protein [Planctomycetota bacterium]